MPMYHPAVALYRPQLREELEKDFKKLKEMLKELS
jgi:DNA polymerase